MASEVVCESRIESVTVYARGAVVRRGVKLPDELPPGPCDVVVEGVTSLADAGSLRASVEGGREVLGVRARLVVPAAPKPDETLAGKLDELRRKRDDLLTERNHAGWRRDLLASVQPDPELVRRALGIDPAERIDDALAIVRLVADEMAALDAKIAALSDAIEKSEREAEALRVAAAQASAAQANAGAPVLSIVVQLGPGKGGAAASALDVEYAVLAARWWPAYRARFTDSATRVALTLSALVAQQTGEDWGGVELTLSTGDLLRDARLPEMPSLRLGRAQRPRPRGYRPPPEGLDAMFEGHDRFVAEVRVTMTATASITMSAQSTTGWSAGHAGMPLAAYTADIPEDDLDSPTRVASREALGEQAPRRAPRPRPAAGAPAAAPQGYAMPGVIQPAPRAAMPAPGASPAGYGPPAAPPSPGAYGPPAAAKPYAAPPALGGFGGSAELARAPSPTGAPPPPAAAPSSMMQAAPPRGGGFAKARMAKEEAADLDALAELDEGTLGGETFASPAAIEPADAWLDFDTLRLDPDASRERRGRLVRDAGPSAARAESAARQIERLEAPAGTTDPRASRGLFDFVYRAAGTADVPSSGRPHRVPVLSAEAPAAPRFVTVPREAPEVYRRADVTNPFGVALLTGPVEVLIDGALVALTRLSYTDRGGLISIGLGVEERVRVARNTRVEEGSAGLLGGSTTVEHTVTTELSSSLGRAIKVDIIDRIPASDDKDVDIKLLSSQPQPAPYTQAELGQPVRKGMKWEVDVPAGGKAKAEWRYRVTLPSKMEIVGGNRRE